MHDRRKIEILKIHTPPKNTKTYPQNIYYKNKNTPAKKKTKHKTKNITKKKAKIQNKPRKK